MTLLYSTLLVHTEKEKSLANQGFTRNLWYPDPGSNRDGLLHWCLRPARLPIPPSGLTFAGANIRRVLDSAKGLRDFFWLWLILFSDITFESCLGETRPFSSINRGSGP